MSKLYTDEELRARAIVVMRHLTNNDNVGIECVIAVAQRTGMHPQAVVNEIQKLANTTI